MRKLVVSLSIIFLLLLGANTLVFATNEQELDDFVGTYRGWYYATQGHTGLTLEVYLNDAGNYEAAFIFYSVPENPSVPSGKFLCDISYNPTNKNYIITGKTWVTRPTNWLFVDLQGIVNDNIYKGKVITSSKSFNFELVKQTGVNETSSWADDTVNKAIISSFVPLELQGSYKTKITRADFSRLTIAAISLMTNKSIEEFMLSNNTEIKSNPFSDTSDLFVTYANSLGIVNGYGNKRFGPNDPITREQAATMLTNLANVFKIKTTASEVVIYKDRNLFSTWAQNSIHFVTNLKDAETNTAIMSGFNNNFDPKGNYTREQAIITIYRLIKAID